MSSSLRKSELFGSTARRIVLAAFGEGAEYEIHEVAYGRNSTRAEILVTANRQSRVFLKVTDPHAAQGHMPQDAVWLASTAQNNQVNFRRVAPRFVNAPLPLWFDDSMGALLMAHSEGQSLKTTLAHRRPVFAPKVPNLVSLAGRALSAWHSLSKTKGAPPGQVMSFTDYAVGNILLQPDHESITVVDFPGLIQHASPYHDLASFLHSVLVVRHDPLSTLAGGLWWDWRDIWLDFAHGYSSDAGADLRREDLETIRSELSKIVGREVENYRRLMAVPRMAIERPWYSLIRYHPALRPGTLASLIGKRGF